MPKKAGTQFVCLILFCHAAVTGAFYNIDDNQKGNANWRINQ